MAYSGVCPLLPATVTAATIMLVSVVLLAAGVDTDAPAALFTVRFSVAVASL
jgi:hypothetical protein